MVVPPSRRRGNAARSSMPWLVVLTLLASILVVPSTSAAGPGNDGNGWPDGGPKSHASEDDDPTLAAGAATMGAATIACSGSTVTSVSGSFTLSKELDDDSTIVVYLAADAGSNASPAGNVSMNYKSVPATTEGAYPFTIAITAPFTITSGGVRVVFAVNDDAGATVISSTKSGPLACSASATASASSSASASATSSASASASASQTGDPQRASILIAKIDDNGNDDPADDVLLDGAEFEVLADDGDGVYEPGTDPLVFGEDEAFDGLLDTDPLPAGRYWIDETIVPDGFVGSDPILVELNLDPSQSCVWDALGLIDCTPNDGGVEGLSWTVVIVENTPEGATGGVGGATGRPRLTLPPTDAATDGATVSIGDSWRLVVLGLAALITVVTLAGPSRFGFQRARDRR